MSSFFTVPGAQKKRKRPAVPDQPKKRIAGQTPGSKGPVKLARPTTGGSRRVERDESISGSDSDLDEDGSFEGVSHASEESEEEEDSGGEAETAAERRLRLAERYLENVKEHVDEAGFDAADIDRDLIAERLQEDVAETKGRVYRQLAPELALGKASQTFFRTNNAEAVTSIAASAPYFYTTTKDLQVHRWRTQDLPQHQWPQTTKKKPKKPPAPPKKKPEMETYVKGDWKRNRDRNYKKHTGKILAVAASPDGQYVVTGGDDKKIIVYESATLKPIKVLMHHRDGITGLAFRRGTNQLYSCSKDRTVKVWSLDEMAYVETLFGHQDEIVDIDALAQERCVSVGARDRTARLWKVMEETQLVFRGGGVDKKQRLAVDPRSVLHEGSMDRIAMLDDDLFVTGSDNGSIALWSVSKKKPVYIQMLAHGVDPPLDPAEASAEVHPTQDAVPHATPRWITALKTIPYSDIILSGSWDGCIRIWKLTEDKRKIEQIGTLGGSLADVKPKEKKRLANGSNSALTNGTGNGYAEEQRPIQGIINDIAVFERGDRGKDGVCVIAGVGKEHRLGRWKTVKAARNGGVLFEVPRIPVSATNGVHAGSEEESES